MLIATLLYEGIKELNMSIRNTKDTCIYLNKAQQLEGTQHF